MKRSPKFPVLLANFLAADVAYKGLPDDHEGGPYMDDAIRQAAWEKRSTARHALLAGEPQTAEQIRQLLGVAVAELECDLTVGGPLPDAVLASLRTCRASIERLNNVEGGALPPIPTVEGIRDMIDDQVCYLDSLSGHLGYLADIEPDLAGTYFTIMNAVNAVKESLVPAVDGLMKIARADKVQP